MAMVVVCAWCERFLGLRHASESPVVTKGICGACAARQYWPDSPTLVVSRKREELAPVLRQLLQGTPEVPVIVDRRVTERRRSNGKLHVPERRSGSDRRQATTLAVG